MDKVDYFIAGEERGNVSKRRICCLWNKRSLYG